MAVADLTDWMDEFGRPGVVWCAKRLAANDTLATNAHQAGPYLPKSFLFGVLPSLNRPDEVNPDVEIDVYIDSHSDHKKARAVWYNKALHGTGTRNETRLTRFGGKSSAMLDPDSTGALTVFAFVLDESGAAKECHAWVCGDDGVEADLIEERLGPVEPKSFVTWTPGSVVPSVTVAAPPSTCRLTAGEILPQWMTKFPTGEEIIGMAISRRPPTGMNVDKRIIRRRECEYEMFLSIEEAVYLPKITAGFTSVDGFLSLAQTILQSRKSRSGNSLELHVREIMKEEGMVAGASFTHKPVVDGGKRPDFIFPSQAAYDDPSFPAERLRMLAAKTTLKDRWRQILREANRIPNKHLITLQEGVSVPQFNEMTEAGVKLVVPYHLHRSYPKAIRPHLITFESFLGDVRLLGVP